MLKPHCPSYLKREKIMDEEYFDVPCIDEAKLQKALLDNDVETVCRMLYP